MMHRMRYIGGLDYSLANCGIGIATMRVDGSVTMNATTIHSIGHDADTLPMRDARLSALTDDVAQALGTCDFIVVEDVIPSKGRLLDRYGGFWFTLHRLIKLGIPLARCSPESMKLALTGKTTKQLAGSNQAKWAVGNAIRTLWPDLNPANDNESDGAALAHLGAVALGLPVGTLHGHREV